ncbi:hypothetical protein KBD08_04670, partial [Candidatus Babeliales bacterium]|nr:hypothetical protein [Candidatus Babeliales bacterium]
MKQRFMLNALILLSIVTVAHAGVDVQPTKPARNMIFNSVKNNKTASPVIDLSNNSATKSGMQLPVMYNDTDFAAEPIQNVTKTPVVSEKPNKIISSPKQQPILPKADSVMPTFEINDALPKLSGDIAPISESENNIVINRSMQNPINFADDAKSVDTP